MKIDILCNDIIAAHEDFIKKLEVISFAANFYENLMGLGDLKEFFYQAGNLIHQQISDVQIAFFVRVGDNFEMYVKENEHSEGCRAERIEGGFSAELVDSICKANKVCSLEEMFAMGLGGNLGLLKKISGYSVPLVRFGASVGFLLIYRDIEKPISERELGVIASVSPGISKKIESYQAMLN